MRVFLPALIALFLALVSGGAVSAQPSPAPLAAFASHPEFLRHGREVSALALAPASRLLAISRGREGFATGHLQVWDLAANEERWHRSLESPILSLACSPSGRILAAGNARGELELWELSTGKLIRRISGHSQAIHAVLFTPDGQRLLSGSQDGTIALWQRATGKLLRKFLGHLDSVQSLALCPRVDRNAPPSAVEAAVRDLFSLSGRLFLISAGRDRAIKVWDLDSGKELQEHRGHRGEITGLALGSPVEVLLSASLDGSVRFCKVPDGTSIMEAVMGLPPIHALAISSKNLIALGSREDGLRLLHIQSYEGAPASVGLAPRERVSALLFTPDGGTLITGHVDGAVKMWSTRNQELHPQQTLPELSGTENPFPILAVACSPDGSSLAVCGQSRDVELLDTATGELQHRLHGHTDLVAAVAFSPDGKTVASAGQDGTVRLWDARRGILRATWKGHNGWVEAIAFSPDGKVVASGGYDGRILLWDLTRGEQAGCFRGHEGGVRCLAFARDGKELVSGSSDRTIRRWDLASGECLSTWKGHEGAVRSLAWDPQGKVLASASDDATVRLWDSRTGKETASYRHKDRALAVAYSPAGDVLQSASLDQTIAVLDPRRGLLRTSLQGHDDGVTCLAFSPDGRHLYSASLDRTLKVWTTQGSTAGAHRLVPVAGKLHRFVALAPDLGTLATGGTGNAITLQPVDLEAIRCPPQGPLPNVHALAYSPDSKALAVGCADGTIRLFDASGRLKQTLTGSGGSILALAFSPDGSKLASTSGDANRWTTPESVKVWDLQSGKQSLQLTGHTSMVFTVSFSPDGKLLATASMDQTARIWDLSTGKEKLSFRDNGGPFRCAVFAPTGSLLATGSLNGSLKLWNTSSGKEVACGRTPRAHLSSIAFSRDGKKVAAAYSGGTGSLPVFFNVQSGEHGGVQVWQVTRGDQLEEQHCIEKMRGMVLGVAFLGDGKHLVTVGGNGSALGEVHLWESASGKEITSLSGPSGLCPGLAVSPDGLTLAVGGGSAPGSDPVHLWSLRPLLGQRELQQAKACYLSATYSSDGALLACGRLDGTVEVWDVARGKLVHALQKHQAAVTLLAFSQDCKNLATSAEDHTACLWSLPSGRLRKSWQDLASSVLDLALSPDGKTLVLCTSKTTDGGPGRLLMWEEPGEADLRPLSPLARDPRCVSLTGDSKILAIGLLDRVLLWDLRQHTVIRSLEGVRAPGSLAFSANGHILAASQDPGGLCSESQLLVWHLDTGKKQHFLGGGCRLRPLHFAASNGTLTAISSNGELHQWTLDK